MTEVRPQILLTLLVIRDRHDDGAVSPGIARLIPHHW